MNETAAESLDTQELSDERMEELASGGDRGSNREIPMTEADRPEAKEAARQAQSAKEVFEFKHGDKPIKATREQIIQWAQMGYGYPQKAQALNQQKAQLEQAQKEMEARFAPYTQVDQWAKSNPNDWKQFEQFWKTGSWRNAGTQTPGTQAPQTAEVERLVQQRLQEQLQPVQSFIQEMQSEKQIREEKEQDQVLDGEIKSIREKFKDLDWNALDENGKSLEVRVLEHATQNEIKSFGTAFRDLLHDQLVQQAAAQAKMSLSRGIQEKTKMGILGQSPMPKKGFSEPKDVRKQSYEELAREAIEEMKSGRAS